MDDVSRLKFQKILKQHLPHITSDQIASLEKYEALLAEWNQKINLVSRKDEENIWSRHIIGSIAFLFQLELDSKSTIVDVGTGGGLPGIPLAILYPECRVTLIDSIQKKITALDDMAARLNLKNVKIIGGRAEEISRIKQFTGSYDYVVSRAVAPIREFMKWCKPFLRTSDARAIEDAGARKKIGKGTFIFLKGGDVSDELSHAKIKFKPREVHQFELPMLTEAPEISDKRVILFKP